MKRKIADIFKRKEIVDKVVEILKMEPILREDNEEMFLADFVQVGENDQKTEIFTKTEDTPKLINFTRNIKLVTKQDGDILFKQGDIGKSFYVILSGAINGLAASEEADSFG
jgi:CRP-like cAMP-binding protein